jgi:hypothetical protein
LVSPILVRPVREQLEHDRVVRLLQTKSRRRFDATANPGVEQNAPIRLGAGLVFPDVLLYSQDRGHRLKAVIEVETGESVNHLEALSQWLPLSKLRVDFFLYVPSNMVDVARRLCEDNQVQVNEIWSYHVVGDQFRFTLTHRVREAAAAPRAARPKAHRPSAARRKAARPQATPRAARAKATRRPARRQAPRGAARKRGTRKAATRVANTRRQAKPTPSARPRKRR